MNGGTTLRRFLVRGALPVLAANAGAGRLRRQ